MPLTPEDDQILAICYRNLQEKPIGPSDPFYVEIWEHSDYDPVARLRKHIGWSEIQSLQLFSGFSGSGKSTQLLRLQRDLSAQGYQVVYANADEYLNLGEPIEVEELLVTMAGAFSDNLDPPYFKIPTGTRLSNYLVKTEVNFKEASFNLSGFSLKTEIKSSPTFRQRVRKIIQSRLPDVRRQVEAFVEEVVKKVKEKDPSKRIVFLFDSFEKLRGTPSNEQEIMASIERLFGSYMEMLQLPFVHCVYSVPAFVQFFITNCELVIIPTIKVWKKREQGQTAETPYQPGRQKLRDILEKRLGKANQQRIFGQPDSEGHFESIETLISASGGALRDMLRLFRETLLAAQSLPVPQKTVLQAISTVRNDFRTSVEDARWLYKIHEEQAADPQTSKASDVNRYMRLLDSHMILFYRNDANWYDTHPLVRDEVKRILALNPEPLPAAKE